MAASDVAGTRAIRRPTSPHVADRAGERPALSALSVTLGALFISIFFDNLFNGHYGSAGYRRVIESYINNPKATAPGFWRHGVMQTIADLGSIAGPMQGLLEIVLGVALVLGVARGLVGLVTAGWLANLWFSQLGIFWVWELLPVTILALVIGLSGLPDLLDRERTMMQRILGPPAFGSLGMAQRLGVAVAGGLGLFAIGLISHTGGGAYVITSVASAIVFALALAALGLIDSRLEPPSGSRA